MLTITNTVTIIRTYDVENNFSDRYGSRRIAYFDIETTGLRAVSHQIYLIGAACRNEDGTFTVVQWFDDTGTDEAKVLLLFREFLKNYDILIDFNGNSFDIPFVRSRAEKYGIHFDWERLKLVDLYREVRHYKSFFKLPDLKQKSLELFLGIFREDQYDGGQLIGIYKRYLTLPPTSPEKETLQHLLLLHNHDDMIGLLQVCDLFSYLALFEGQLEVTGLQWNTKDEAALKLRLQCHLDYPVKAPVYNAAGEITCKAENDSLVLLISAYKEELKHFFTPYRDYYYLPEEDTAIHKSVAQFVDPQYRRKATKENCYIKKQGIFLHQPEMIFTPSFQRDHTDKKMYFEVTEDRLMLTDETAVLWKEYIHAILQKI